MGFLDFFKRKKKDSYLDNLPPAMRKAFDVLFPKGVDDHNRQLDELSKHFGGKYKREDIDSYLIFILTGYLITGDSKTKESSIDKLMARKIHHMSKADVEHLYDFALSNHPKLSSLLTLQSAMDVLSDDGCDTDTIPGGRGLFGFSSENPIPTHGVEGIYEYLDHLRDKKGNKIKYERIGSVETCISQHPVDLYKITSPNNPDTIRLFLSAYHKRNSQLSPSNFVLVDSNDIVVSSGGTEFAIGHRCIPNNPPTQKLVAINYFGLISPKDYANFPTEIVEAEKLNYQGFIKSNNGDTEGAIATLNLAIERGSANAINSLFAVLHSADRFQEALLSLRAALQHGHRSAALFYNLAVIYSGYDTHYTINPDKEFVISYLKKSLELPEDGTEEFRASIQNKAKAFLKELGVSTESKISSPSSQPKQKPTDSSRQTIATLPANIQDIIAAASVALIAVQKGDRKMEQDFLIKMFNLVQESCSQILQIPDAQCNIVGTAFSLLLSYPQIQANEDVARAIADYAFYCISRAIASDPKNEILRAKRLSILTETRDYFFYTIANAMELPDYNPLDFFASMPLQIRTNSYLYAIVKYDLTFMKDKSYDGPLGNLIKTASNSMSNDTPENGGNYVNKIMEYLIDTFKKY